MSPAARYLLDTNTVAFIVNGRSTKARKRLKAEQAHSAVSVSAITQAEILFGLEKKPEATRLRAAVAALFQTLPVLAWDGQDPLEKREYIRFVVGRQDEDSHVERGIFQAAALALEWQNITGSDADELNEVLGWFSRNLEKPTSFGRDKLRLGICWFKAESTEHISRIWGMVRILERNGIYVKKIRTNKPGYLIYEDKWQLVAEPFRKGTMRKS
jgi:hypothetical protein